MVGLNFQRQGGDGEKLSPPPQKKFGFSSEPGPAPSTERIRVPSGPSGLAEQGLLFEHFFLFQIFQAGWERVESIRF